MDRLACVDLPALPLQVLLHRHPGWAAGPAVVVADERAQSPVLWVNAAAAAQGIRPGMRHAAALSLAHALNAGTVEEAEVAQTVAGLTDRLQRHSPHVEPSREVPGVFWVGAGGLYWLHPDPEVWAAEIAAGLEAAGWRATVVLGFRRFGVYAVARAGHGVMWLDDPAQERRLAGRVSLERLGVPPAQRDELERLGVETLAELLRLPPIGLLERFGPALYRLHRLAAGLLEEAFTPRAEELPVEQRLQLEPAETDTVRLLFRLKYPLQTLLHQLGSRQEALAVLHLRLLLEGAPPRETEIRPAHPTRDITLLLDLVRLRLERLAISAGVAELELLARGAPREVDQLSLFPEGAGRDPVAGGRALARVRAEFGETAVVRACLRDAHLPEGGFAWEPLDMLPGTRAGQATRSARTGRTGRTGKAVQVATSGASGGSAEPAEPPLVRRLLTRPAPLPGGADIGPAGPGLRALGRALGCGPLARLHGPYPLSGGWWTTERHRDYYFAESGQGGLYWIYRDRGRRRWFLHGRVE